jgi:hypothetical protein
MRTRLILAAALGLVIVPAAMAAAAPLDRVLIDGYDPLGHRYVFGLFDADDPCAEYEGGENLAYSTATTTTSSTATTAAEDEGGRDWTVTEVTVAGAPGDCLFSSVSVEGPNGQVNHGTFVSAFVHAIQGLGNPGCLVRMVAGSELGKGSDQVRAEDSSSSTTTTVAGPPATPTITLEAMAACDRGGKPEDDDRGTGKPDWAGHGKPDWAGQGKPDWAGEGKPEDRGNDR